MFISAFRNHQNFTYIYLLVLTFLLRLIPAFPFFLVNLGMGLTAIRVTTYFWVSLVGMLPGSLLYVNAGQTLATLDTPKDLLSLRVVLALAFLGLVPLLIRWLSNLKIFLGKTIERGHGRDIR